VKSTIDYLDRCLINHLDHSHVIVIAFIVIDFLEIGANVRVRQGRASLAKNLPPDVQADMKPKLLNLVSVLAFAAVVLLLRHPLEKGVRSRFNGS